MKISMNWLNQYIELDDFKSRLDELSSLLTKAGLEVEDMINPAKNWNNVVVGRLVEVGQHPDADKLTLCQVDVGADKPLAIVCGAKNHKQGDLVAVATVGAILPGDFKIKKSKIRGVESFGMLCSETELGLSDEADGILILDPSLKPGQAFAEVCDSSDIIFDLNVTPNRADCLSHIGLARELSTLLDRPVKIPTVNNKESDKAGSKEISKWIEVDLRDSESCPRFCGRMITGLKIGPSPDWLKRSLEAIGVNSVNNVVDVTNYVLFEYGQPLHAYDYDQLKDSKIIVEKALDKEKFVSLDGTEIELSEQDLVIRDGARAVGIAGVIGGQNTGVSETTQNIFVEAAFFKAESVRHTSRAHGIETDACYRFARGVDAEQTLNALNRAVSLIIDVAGGELQKGEIDLYPKPLKFNDIEIKTEYVSERLGFTVEAEEFSNWMKRLGCVVAPTKEGFKVTPPTFRWDIKIKEDLVEEFARLHGYDAIEEKLPIQVEAPTNHVPIYTFSNKVASALAGFGLHQAVNYAFENASQSQTFWGDKQSVAKLGLKMGATPIKLVNPLSEELAVMRESLLPSLFKNLLFNVRHENHTGRLFELAPAHRKEGEEFLEQNRLALAFWGQNEGLWNSKQANQVVFQLKSVVESLLGRIGGNNFRWDQLDASNCPPGFHPAQTVSLFYEGKVIGLLGSLHPSIKDGSKIRSQVAIAEFDLDALMVRQPRQPKFKALAKYPAVERDVAFLAEASIPATKIMSEIKRAAGPLLAHCEVFDTYQDKELKDAGRRSIAFRMRFQSANETLKDDEINSVRDKVVNSLSQKLGLEIR